jgi:RsiW-degrading membrane proteinase PrsW (M82 family)
MGPGASMNRRLRISGVLAICGLLVEALCLVWSKPIAFVVLACIGGALISAGVLVFLYSLLSAAPHSRHSSGTADDEH